MLRDPSSGRMLYDPSVRRDRPCGQTPLPERVPHITGYPLFRCPAIPSIGEVTATDLRACQPPGSRLYPGRLGSSTRSLAHKILRNLLRMYAASRWRYGISAGREKE